MCMTTIDHHHSAYVAILSDIYFATRYFNPGTVFITAAILFLGYTAQKQNGGRDENCAGIKVPNRVSSHH